MKPKKAYRGETTPEEEKQLNLTRSALDLTLTDFESAFVLGMRDGSLATSSNIDKEELAEILIGLAREFAPNAMLENSDIEVHERYSQEQNTTEEFDDLIDVLVALKNGKIDEREAQATLKIEMGLTSDVAEKLVSSILLGNLIATFDTRNKH